MDTTKERAILFADLRGSTALYFKLGNSEAATLVTHSLAMLGQIVARAGGRVIKTLGDGLMAVYGSAESAIDSAESLHEALDRIAPFPDDASTQVAALKLKVAVAWGEMVEVDGDCFGDAVNVAARLLDLAGDNETLTTAQLLRELPSEQHERFRSIDKLHLRGRKDPVAVLRMDNRRFGDTQSTMMMEPSATDMPEGVRLEWLGSERIFLTAQMPIVLGRSPQASFCVNDSRVSRAHACLESHSGQIYLTDLSYNGTHVQFGQDEQVLTLRRGTCTLHGSGVICMGTPTTDPTGAQLRFEVLSFAETQPQ